MQKINQLDSHRNGVCGMPFFVAIVNEKDEDGAREMLVIRFPKEYDKDGVMCAAFDLALLDKREIRFCYNSWRGDHYADIMDEAIAKARGE